MLAKPVDRVSRRPPVEANRWIRRRLPGHELIWDNQPVGLLNLLPTSDWVLQQYVGESDVWSTVTPVVLPGYDDPDHLRRKLNKGTNSADQKMLLQRLDARIDGLLRKAIVQAGFPATLADLADLAWRLVGFHPGDELANRYCLPAHLHGKRRCHGRIQWKNAGGGAVFVKGPVVIGAGRYSGMGLFARQAG